MSLSVRHLNCGTLCPVGGFLPKSLLPKKIICHCLLVETSSGLVLVDTGLGTLDLLRPRRRLGFFAQVIQPDTDPAHTALEQVKRLGFSPNDVTDIVLTHLDLDHAGGLSDFPRANIHVYAPEYSAAHARVGIHARMRYRPCQWSHQPKWVQYNAQGEKWFGFDSVRELKGLPPEILLIPLTGHSLGHTGVAVQTKTGWLLHAGDAYFYHQEMNLERPRCPQGLKMFQRFMQADGESRVHNQKRLRTLRAEHGGEVEIFCAHDSIELARLQA